ncbi:MAG: Lhr family helicase, partial [Terriglobales bacterium]
QRMRAEDLLAAAFPMQVGCQDNHGGEDLEIPAHPYVQETMRDCLHEFLDVDGLRGVLGALASGAITVSAVDTPAPSGLAQEILNIGPYGFLDDAPLEERRARAVHLGATAAAAAPGQLDAAAVAAVCAEAWPQPQSAEEVHDLLLSTLYWPDAEIADIWRGWLEELRREGRIFAYREGWAATERVPLLRGEAATGGLAGAVWGGVEFAAAAPAPEEAALERLVGGWMEIVGPVTATALAARLGLPEAAVATALLALEGQGRVLRCEGGAWCERGLLARIHRRMREHRRAAVSMVSPAVFYAFLRRWQHLEAGTRLHGVRGLEAVLEQLQGFEAPAQAWEQHLLPARVADYEPEFLDQLCLSGAFTWARLAPGGGHRTTPARNSPLTFFRRQEAAWLPAACGWAPDVNALSPNAATVLGHLRQRGASFFADLLPPGLVASQLEDALWELVAAGLATADGFDNLRAFLDPKRRSGTARNARPRHSPGRWALLAPSPAPDLSDEAVRMDLAEKQAQLWLRRYGVIFKALLEREACALPWYEVLLACRRLEARGLIRGGRFVSGFAGEQFALPQAHEALAAHAGAAVPARTPLAARPAPPADPLNLTGIILPGERISPQRLAIA